MSQNRSEPLVKKLYRHIGKKFFEPVDKRGYIAHTLGRLVIHLPWQPHDDPFDRLSLHILREKIDQLRRCHGCQSVCYNLQRISHRYARTLSSVIY